MAPISPNSYIDPDGVVWDFIYVVTQTEAEGPEYVEGYRLGEKVDDLITWHETPVTERITEDDWEHLPRPVREAYEHRWFGAPQTSSPDES
jgi:hypothetical protein